MERFTCSQLRDLAGDVLRRRGFAVRPVGTELLMLFGCDDPIAWGNAIADLLNDAGIGCDVVAIRDDGVGLCNFTAGCSGCCSSWVGWQGTKYTGDGEGNIPPVPG